MGGTPTQLAEYFVKRLLYETQAHNTPRAHTNFPCDNMGIYIFFFEHLLAGTVKLDYVFELKEVITVYHKTVTLRLKLVIPY